MKLERLGGGWIRGSISASGSGDLGGGLGAGDLGEIGDLGGGGRGLLAGAGSTIGEGLTSGGSGELTEAEIEERELVEWASLKECQRRFMRENGVDGELGLL